MSITAALLLCLAATVKVDVAPDQPLPFVYVDDPLIVELQSDTEARADLTLEVAATQHATPFIFEKPNLLLRATDVRWCAFKDLPEERGFYTATVKVALGDDVQTTTHPFCRIDRLGRTASLPVCAQLATDPLAQLALGSVAVRTLRMEAADANAVTEASRLKEAGFRLVIVVRPGLLEMDPDRIKALSSAVCDVVQRWEVDPAGDAAALIRLSEAIRAAECSAPVAVVAENAKVLDDLMKAGAGGYAREAVLLSDAPDPLEVAAARRAIEQAGYEDWRIHVLGRGLPPEAGADPGALIKQILVNFTSGVAETGFDAALVYDGTPHEPMAFLNGLVGRLSDTRFGGWLEIKDVVAPLFRSGATWFLPIWAEKDTEVSLDIGEVSAMRLTDALGNPIRLPEYDSGTIALTVGPSPLYLTGVRGNLPGQAARARARALAGRIAKSDTFKEHLPEGVLALAAAIAKAPGGDASREQFFALIRQLPELERRWHEGDLPRGVAVPAIAQISRLARSLCTVEEYRGEPFLEPLQEMLAHCEEFQSLYLTSSVGTSEAHVRGDWLLNEVRRLMDEASHLAASDRRIEASAVAALAEWRARGLEFAAKAGPLGAPDRVAAEAAVRVARDLDKLSVEDRP